MAKNDSYIISCCSTVDTDPDFFEEKDVHYVCFHYFLDDVEYRDDFGQSMPMHDFYQKMTDGAMTRTSQVNAEEFIDYFTPFLEDGKDIFHVCLSSGISGVMNSAVVAASELRDQYPSRRIIVMDSLSASSGYALIVSKLAELRDSGYTLEELETWMYNYRQKDNTWFFTTDLTFFIRGGRVGKVSGWFGTQLNICPLLNVNKEGKLIPRSKHRGKKTVKKAIVDTMLEWAEDGAFYNNDVYITHSDCYEDAREVADMIESAFPQLKEKVRIYYVGTTIGSHTGPGTVALAFWGRDKQL